MDKEILIHVRKTLKLMINLYELSHKISKGLMELSTICENNNKLIEAAEVQILFESIVKSRSLHGDNIDKVREWESKIIKIRKVSQRKLTDGEQQEATHLIGLGVSKAKVCKKYNVSYTTLQKYLTMEVD